MNSIREMLKELIDNEITDDMIADAIRNNIDIRDIRNDLNNVIESYVTNEIGDVVEEIIMDRWEE